MERLGLHYPAAPATYILAASVFLFAVIVGFRMNRLERMGEHKVADLVSLFDPVLNCGAKMNSSIDPGFTVLGSGL